MTRRSAAEVAFGVLGVYVVVSQVASGVPSFSAALWSPMNEDYRWFPLIVSAINVAGGVGLFAFRRGLAAMVSPASPPAEEGEGTGGVQAAAIAVIGVFFFASGLQTVVGEQLVHSNFTSGRSPQSFVEMVVGAALFFGARGIVALWQWLRTAGRSAD